MGKLSDTVEDHGARVDFPIWQSELTVLELARHLVARVQPRPHRMKLQTLKDLYVHQLKALNSGEEQMLEMLPKMIQAANAELAAAFQAHLEQI